MQIIKCNVLKTKASVIEKNIYKDNLKLSQEQKDIIIGNLLGDGYLEKHGTSHRFYFCQSGEKMFYVEYIYNIFEPWCSSIPSFSFSRYKEYNTYTKAAFFRTATNRSFNFFGEQFYCLDEKSNRKKRIPNKISRWLSARALAFWFMDEGAKNENGYILNTQNFCLKEQEILCDALGRNFKFEVNIHRDRQNYRLYITSKSRDLFTRKIEPYILEGFRYKLHI
jgi:hypothetical protein